MLPFDYRGRDWQAKNRLRSLLLEAILGVLTVLLFPFTLLSLLLWTLWDFAQPRPTAR
jgi:hypothetical protein